jgi:hypothetical protein
MLTARDKYIAFDGTEEEWNKLPINFQLMWAAEAAVKVAAVEYTKKIC